MLLRASLLLCQAVYILSVPLIVSPAYKRNLLEAIDDHPVPPELHRQQQRLTEPSTRDQFTPAEAEVLRQLLRNGDTQAWEAYGDEVDGYLNELQANDMISSVEEGLVRLLYPELSDADVDRLVSQTDRLLATLDDNSGEADDGDFVLPDAEDIHKYQLFTPEIQSDLPSLEDSLIQNALEAKKEEEKPEGQLNKKEEERDSHKRLKQPISDAEMLTFLSNLQPIENSKRSVVDSVTTQIPPVPKAVELKRGQPEVPFYPGGHFKPKK